MVSRQAEFDLSILFQDINSYETGTSIFSYYYILKYMGFNLYFLTKQLLAEVL
jgi:hypothetical protein